MADAAPPTLFLSNLPYSITDDELTEALSPYGTIVGIRKITDKYVGRRVPNGVAFVEFSNQSELNAALRAPLVIDGRQIVLEAARPRTVHKRDTAFISGIPSGTTKEDLINAFKGFRPVDAKVVRENSLEGRGYGFVKFASPDDQELAVRERMHIILQGEESVVRFANRGFDEPPPATVTRARGRRVRRTMVAKDSDGEDS
jgi:RNA recognition motif-containing protein